MEQMAKIYIPSKSIVRFLVKSKRTLEDFPFEYAININDEVECQLDNQKVSKLFEWMADRIDKKLISYYSVATETLNDSYGELAEK